MAGLELLIRLARRETEAHQVQLSEIGRARADADAAVVAQERDFAAESELAATDLQALAAFSTWGPMATRQAAALRQRSQELARSQQAAQDVLRASYVDMKRLEIARDAALSAANRELQRRADVLADEREQMRRERPPT